MTDKQITVWDTLSSMDTESVLLAITNYHGLQLLDDGFYKFLKEEGAIEAETVRCALCGTEIDKDEYEENGSPECYDCGDPLCHECIVRGYDENMRCLICNERYEEEREANILTGGGNQP